MTMGSTRKSWWLWKKFDSTLFSSQVKWHINLLRTGSLNVLYIIDVRMHLLKISDDYEPIVTVSDAVISLCLVTRISRFRKLALSFECPQFSSHYTRRCGSQPASTDTICPLLLSAHAGIVTCNLY